MSDEDTIDASRAPLLDHLIELRRRLLFSLLALAAMFALSFYFSEWIFGILVRPLLKAGQSKLIYTQLFEAFFVQLKVAFFAAIMLSFPVIANQLWQFVAPGLYRKEKRALLPFLLATPLLFGAGACLAYFVAIPGALHFLLGYQGNVGGVDREALPSVDNYLSFVMQFLMGFGIAFLLPVLLMLLERAGIVTLKQLVKAQRYAILGCFAIALFLAPPDAGSMIMLASPLVVLYYLTLVAIWLTHRRRARTEASETAA
ncbi:twin-arginine translocase subunit TatC [Sphingomonas bacterium]|uniref:twin-arginine translocase subunit TatC n=1 Tax=Sphingomonas bacterium TaxID=1895847 RepID=UPI002626ECA7|nr:twin-arginine translocase subunit TatC [Sphingomonas bacterium]MDB5678326.1 MttB family protein [Sphingomonas bacterium]